MLKVLLLLTLLVPGVATAMKPVRNSDIDGAPHPRSIPEFDPAAAGTIAALVAGGALILARRRRR